MTRWFLSKKWQAQADANLLYDDDEAHVTEQQTFHFIWCICAYREHWLYADEYDEKGRHSLAPCANTPNTGSAFTF